MEQIKTNAGYVECLVQRHSIGGEGLADITGTWLKGSIGVVSKMPGQIAEQLSGKTFNSFDEFRSEFWKAVGNDPYLAPQFSKSNRSLMADGNAPFVSPSQQLGGQKTY